MTEKEYYEKFIKLMSNIEKVYYIWPYCKTKLDVTKKVTKIRDIIQYDLEGIYKRDHKCPNCKEIKQIYFMEYQEILSSYDTNYFQKMKLKDYFEPSHFEFEENC